MYHTAPTLKTSFETDQESHASHAIFTQLRFVLSRAIVKQEVQVLSEIDKLSRGTGPAGRHNPIAVWVSLWMLLLSYKEHMIYIKAPMKGTLGLTSWQFCSCQIENGPEKLALVQHLYNAITSIYAALYKTTSPLTLDWRTEEIASMLGNDVELIRLFSIIKAEMFWFRKLDLPSRLAAQIG